MFYLIAKLLFKACPRMPFLLSVTYECGAHHG
jgi:hypothetical protein